MATAKENKEAATAVGAAIAAAQKSADMLAFSAANDIATLVRSICKEKGFKRLILQNPIPMAYYYKGSAHFATERKGFQTNTLFLGEFEYSAEHWAVSLCYAFPRAYQQEFNSTYADFTADDTNSRIAIWHYVGQGYGGLNDYPRGAWAAAGAYARVLEALEAGKFIGLTEGRTFPEEPAEDDDAGEGYDRHAAREDAEEHEALQRELYG